MIKKHGIVFSGGKHFPGHPFYKSLKGEYILCADSGYESAVKEGLEVDMVIGDLDSLSANNLAKIKNGDINFYKWDKEDDLSDTELAINFFKNQGFTSIDIINALGSRLDHSLVNIMTLLKYEGLINSIKNPYAEIKLLDKETIYDKACIVSIVPLLGFDVIVDISGFQYGTKDTKIEYATSTGISNRLIKDKGTIYLKEGKALLIKTWEESNE